MAFPHPQSRHDHYRDENKPSLRGIARKFFKRTIDIAEYRNAEDKVNPANNRGFGGIFHDDVLLPFQPPAEAHVRLEIVLARPAASHGTPAPRSKIPRRCDTQKPC